MHYYKRNLGDYAKKAGRLSMLQHGAYNQLIDACYDREEFPTKEQAIDWVWASTTEEREAVEFVLHRFFDLQSDGRFVQKRIQEEVETYHLKAAKNKRIAQERETKRAQNNTKRVRSVHEPPPNQEPRTKNQEPIKHTRRFSPPEREAVQDQITTMGYRYADADDFINFYGSKNWMVGKNKMTDWRKALGGWESRKRADAERDNGRLQGGIYGL